MDGAVVLTAGEEYDNECEIRVFVPVNRCGAKISPRYFEDPSAINDSCMELVYTERRTG